MVDANASPSLQGTNKNGLSPTFQATSANTRSNPVPTNNYGNEFESYIVSALNDSLIRKSKFEVETTWASYPAGTHWDSLSAAF